MSKLLNAFEERDREPAKRILAVLAHRIERWGKTSKMIVSSEGTTEQIGILMSQEDYNAVMAEKNRV
jgi:hypothetical protein